MNLRGILKRVARLETAPLLDAMQFPIPAHSGMLGLKMAIEAVSEARQSAPPSASLGDMPSAPLSPMARLRSDILAERARREAMGESAYADVPAIYPDEPQEQTQCALPITPPPQA
jgi:hypothetical protein